jgi:hypothetical protein
MFIVRTIYEAGEVPEFEAFANLDRARMRYGAKKIRAFDGTVESVALFAVQDVSEEVGAIAALEAGDKAAKLVEATSQAELRAAREAVHKGTDDSGA